MQTIVFYIHFEKHVSIMNGNIHFKHYRPNPTKV